MPTLRPIAIRFQGWRRRECSSEHSNKTFQEAEHILKKVFAFSIRRMVEAIGGQRTIGGIIQGLAGPAPAPRRRHEQVRSLFQRLWWYDQVVFDISGEGNKI